MKIIELLRSMSNIKARFTQCYEEHPGFDSDWPWQTPCIWIGKVAPLILLTMFTDMHMISLREGLLCFYTGFKGKPKNYRENKRWAANSRTQSHNALIEFLNCGMNELSWSSLSWIKNRINELQRILLPKSTTIIQLPIPVYPHLVMLAWRSLYSDVLQRKFNASEGKMQIFISIHESRLSKSYTRTINFNAFKSSRICSD